MAPKLCSFSVALHLLNIAGCTSYLLSTPGHAMVRVGSNASFHCQSSIIDGISWSFTPRRGIAISLHDGIIFPSGAILSVYITGNKASTIHLRGVGSEDSGTFKCADDNEAAFADLTVISSTKYTGLAKCPVDTITTVGEDVVLDAAGTPGSVLRWYKKQVGQSDVVIYTGQRLDYTQVDGRYSVDGSSLVIRDVRSSDAGDFVLKDEITGTSTNVKLVVIEPESARCRRRTGSSAGVEFTCEVQYKGSIEPTTQWVSASGEESGEGRVHVSVGKVESRLRVTAMDLVDPPTQCRVSFSRQCCGEQRSAYTRPVQCSPESGITPAELAQLLVKHPVFVAVAVAVSLVVFISLVVSLIVLCARRCGNKRQSSTSAKSLLASESSASASSPVSLDANISGPYDLPTQYENSPVPAEYETLPDSYENVNSERRIVRPLYTSVLTNQPNDYEEPVVTS